MFTLTWSACQKPDGNQPIGRLLELSPVAHFFVGDYYYNDAGGQVDMFGVSHVPTVYGPTGNNTLARNLARFVNVYGELGLRTYRRLWEARRAKKLKIYAMPDDHDGCWNNNDHSLTVFKGAYNVAGGTLSGMLDAAVTQADVLAQWRLGQTALATIQAAYFDNVWGPPNGGIPAAMVGTATAADYATKYFSEDYDVQGNELAPGMGQLSHRVIVPDCISYKSPSSDADIAGKTMLGAIQLEWVKSLISDAFDVRRANHVVMIWTKDLLNRDNGDGGVGYQAEIYGLLQWIHDNGYAVIHGTGDRHIPHASVSRVSNGARFDAAVACACPTGQGTGTLTQYPENDWSWPFPDACVLGKITCDENQRATVLSILDLFSLQPLWEAVIPWGQRLPISITRQTGKDFRPLPAPNTRAQTVPASGAAFTNTEAVPVAICINGGTITVIEVTRDQTTWYQVGTNRGQFVLAPGDALRMTYSVAPTTFVTFPLSV